MTPWLITAWLGNGFYFTRFLLQWLSSERSGRSVTPPSFWWLSLAGCICLGAYVMHLGELLLLPSYLVNGAIYARNLWTVARGDRSARLGPWTAALLGVGAAVALIVLGAAAVQQGPPDSAIWVFVALVGQLVGSTRFLLQWWYAERTAQNRFPTAFWWYTLAGSGFNIAYTVHLGDVALIAGFALTPLYAIRNLMLARPEESKQAQPS